MTFKSYREYSKTNWGIDTADENITIAQINCGSLQRIADAAEKIALRYTELIDKAERLQKSVDYWRLQCDKRDRILSARKGQITKLRNTVKKMKQANDAAFEAAKERA